MFQKFLILCLTCALLCAPAWAEGASDNWEITVESGATMKLLYRIPVDAPQPAAIPDEWNAAEGDARLKLDLDGALYDFGRSSGRALLATPADLDAAALLGFFWTEAEVQAALAAAEAPGPDGGDARYRCADAWVSIGSESGSVRYERDGLDWSGAEGFSQGSLDVYDYAHLRSTDARYAGPEQALADAQALLARANLGVTPVPVEAYGAFEHMQERVRNVEIHIFALTVDGIPVANHAQQHPSEELMLPAQELKLFYDAAGLASAYLTAFRFEAVDGDAQPLDPVPALENLRAGNGAFLFVDDIDDCTQIPRIELQYYPAQARFDGLLYVPAWRMSTQGERWSASWFNEAVCASYNAFDGAPL